jgi:hypothetical protein
MSRQGQRPQAQYESARPRTTFAIERLQYDFDCGLRGALTSTTNNKRTMHCSKYPCAFCVQLCRAIGSGQHAHAARCSPEKHKTAQIPQRHKQDSSRSGNKVCIWCYTTCSCLASACQARIASQHVPQVYTYELELQPRISVSSSRHTCTARLSCHRIYIAATCLHRQFCRKLAVYNASPVPCRAQVVTANKAVQHETVVAIQQPALQLLSARVWQSQVELS